MDKRLIGQFDWTNGQPAKVNLCVYAVLHARLDRKEPTQTTADESLNVYLSHVLSFAFQPTIMAEVANGDYLGLVERLRVQARRRSGWGIAQYIGDRLLFFTSQKSRVGRATEWSLSTGSMIGHGRLAYAIAAQNARSSRRLGHHQLFSRLSEDWQNIQPLLTTAGDILGFDPDLQLLVNSGQSATTIENLLTEISDYGRNPTIEQWHKLVAVVNRLKHTKKDFHYDLPPCPPA